VIVKSLSYILLLMVPEQVWDWHFCSYWCVFFVFCLFFVSPCLVLSMASWGSVSIAVSSSSWENLHSYERYIHYPLVGCRNSFKFPDRGVSSMSTNLRSSGRCDSRCGFEVESIMYRWWWLWCLQGGICWWKVLARIVLLSSVSSTLC
jgi:hypothetical protein